MKSVQFFTLMFVQWIMQMHVSFTSLLFAVPTTASGALLVLPAVASQLNSEKTFDITTNSFNLPTLSETLHGHVMDLHIKNSPIKSEGALGTV
jgi:hypothetical protein